MYLSADRLALANQTALETFEQCSIAWQAIPHWDTGDPGQTQVRNDVINNPAFLDLDTRVRNRLSTNARPDERADPRLAARRSDREDRETRRKG